MEKGLVFDIRRYSVHDGPGIRTTVFLKGCPLNCYWCHNPEGLLSEPQSIKRIRTINGKKKQYSEIVGRYYSVDEVMEIIIKDRLFYDESAGGVTFSGGEPLMQEAFLMALLSACDQYGIHTAIDTSGYAPPEAFKASAKLARLFLFDIKSLNNTMHLTHTGAENKLILDNLESLAMEAAEIIIRIPVIPDFNNQKEEMQAIADFISPFGSKIRRVDLLPYHPLGCQKYKNLNMPSQINIKRNIPTEDMRGFMRIFSDAGFAVKREG